MKVTICACADFASAGEGGKLNVMGVFDRIGAKNFPITHKSMALILRVLVDYADSETTKDIQVQMRGPDGAVGLKIEGKVPVPTLSPGDYQTRNMLFMLEGVPFPKSGTYIFEVRVDGAIQVELPLILVKT